MNAPRPTEKRLTVDQARDFILGAAPQITEVEEVADTVVQGILREQFWMLPPSERSDATIKARAGSMLQRTNPAYFRDWRAEASKK